MTSHEMRTPATIAIGYAEMLIAREPEAQRREDLEVIRDELTRLVLVGGRLVRAIRMHDDEEMHEHSLAGILQEVADRWKRGRRARTGWFPARALRTGALRTRMRACVDTLVENALALHRGRGTPSGSWRRSNTATCSSAWRTRAAG